MAKFPALMLLALLAITVLQETSVLASQGGHHHNKNHYGPGSLKSYRVTDELTGLDLPNICKIKKIGGKTKWCCCDGLCFNTPDACILDCDESVCK